MKKFTVVPGGNAHTVRSGYMSIDASLAVSGPQKHGSC